MTEPGRPTDAEIGLMRTPRVLLFFVVCFAYSGVLISGFSSPAGFDQRPWGFAVAALTVLVAATSATRVPRGRAVRIGALLLLGWVFSALIVFNAIALHLQAATLIFYPAGTCWIEVTLAYMVMRRENQES